MTTAKKTELKAAVVRDYCRQRGYPQPVFEYRFVPGRKFQADCAWPSLMVLLEFEGGLWGMGPKCHACGQRRVAGHGSIERTKSDKEKYNLAALAGWRLLRVTPDDVESGAVFVLLDRLWGRREEPK